jgi:hypothetical protein
MLFVRHLKLYTGGDLQHQNILIKEYLTYVKLHNSLQLHTSEAECET